MKKLLRYLITTACLLVSWQAFAYTGSCTSDNSLPYSFTENVGQTENTVGYTTAWQTLGTDSGHTYTLTGGCDGASTYYSGQPAAGLTLASSDSDGTTWYNISGNSYLQVATEIYMYNRLTGLKYVNVPFTDLTNSCDYKCVGKATSGSKVGIRLKIKKKFVGASFIVNQPVAYLYANQGATGLSFGTPIATVNLNATMTVPQSCTINAGQIVDFDFGTLSAQSFARAGAGQKPSTAQTLTKTVSIACNNIAAQTTMTIRIQANTISGNALVSDNSDVGFVLADSSGNALTPNNANSVIPFTLDDNDAASVGLEAWPVSITGNQPAAGQATALGYLRVDFK